MKLKMLDSNKEINLADKVFKQPVNEALVHQVVLASIPHRGTRAQKNRAEVRGGGKKPWRQKGTGRARAGSSRNPIWRGGGVAFAARPHIKKMKTNRKMYRQALRAILSSLVKDKRLLVMGDIALKKPKTKELTSLLSKHNFHRGAVVVDKLDQNLLLASRNLAQIRVIELSQLNPASLITPPRILFTQTACEQLQQQLSQ